MKISIGRIRGGLTFERGFHNFQWGLHGGFYSRRDFFLRGGFYARECGNYTIY